MKRTLTAFIFLLAGSMAFGQDSIKGFKKDHLFTGGSVSLSFANSTFGAGVSPVFGYSLTKWIDAGLAINYFYISQKYSSTIKLRQSTYGAGPFVRIFPVNFLFVQGQFEKNFITYKEIYSNGNPTIRDNRDANSLLLGAGYATGRTKEIGAYGYFSVLFDVMDDKDSPYYSLEYTQSGEIVRTRTPIIRAGFHIPLFQGRNRDR
jgi:hypothetical protein